MASLFIIKSLIIFSQLLLILLLVSSSDDQDGKCPSTFECGYLGTITFPFTSAQHSHCGVLAIHGCDHRNPYAPKSIQLSNTPTRKLGVTLVEPPNTIAIKDETQHEYVRNKSCMAFNNYNLPPSSPLGSVHIKYNVTLFRCNKSLSLALPQHFHNYTNCTEYNIYYHFASEVEKPSGFRWPWSLTQCSKVQLPIKEDPEDNDPFAFLTHDVVMEVQVSDDCRKCIDHKRGQCQLDSQRKLSCVRDKNSAWKLGLGIGLPSFIIIGLLLVIWLWKPRCRLDFFSNPEPKSVSVYFGVPVFSYKDLEVATKKFNRSRELGDGGFGTVYYGKLKDGREVAVKRLYEHSYRGVQQFMNEVQILTRLRHKNLVSLYGCTSRHSRELLLVYEYISNGTVACHLHGELAKTTTLPWHTRMKIAVETAAALAYLHASGIIHRDVKTNNILLDNNFTIKVADFGLSRLFPNDVTHVSTAPQGTPGYVDPEYHRCYQLTSKSDVYSFGVVLIELISSKLAVDTNRHKDEINLSDLAVKKIQKSAISELVDLSLGFDSDNEVKRMIVWVAELAFQCLQRDRELRPSMDEVLKALRRIEGGNDEGGRLEEVDIDCEGMSPSPASPDHDEVKLLKSMKETPSPKAVTDKWKSECTTPNVSGQSQSQTTVGFRSY